MRHDRGPLLRQGQTIDRPVKGCAGTGLVAFRPFNGKSACPFCMKDVKVKPDNTLRAHSGKRKAYL